MYGYANDYTSRQIWVRSGSVLIVQFVDTKICINWLNMSWSKEPPQNILWEPPPYKQFIAASSQTLISSNNEQNRSINITINFIHKRAWIIYLIVSSQNSVWIFIMKTSAIWIKREMCIFTNYLLILYSNSKRLFSYLFIFYSIT